MKKNLPTISLNKLAEFTGQTKARQKAILKTIKSTKVEDFTKRITYATPKSALKTYFVNPDHDSKIFEEKKKSLQNSKPTSDFKKRDILNSILAISAIEKCKDSLLTPYLTLESRRGLPKGYSTVLISGVLVHLAPDIAFYKNTKDNIIGGMKLVFSKNRNITPLEGQIIAGLLRQQIQKKFKTEVETKNCIAFDVFAKKIYTAPAEFDYHLMRLKKAYTEIKSLWSAA